MSIVTAAAPKSIRDEVAALKRERTIAVAVDLFYDRGYENTSLDAVAEQMSVTKPFIYAHFTSKAELLAEICSRGIASALDALDSVLGMSGSPTERLREVGLRFVSAVLQNQRHIAIFSREEKNLTAADYTRISEMRREFDHKLVKLLDEGVVAGEFHVTDTRMAALGIGGMISWAYVWYRSHGRFTLEQTAEALTELILRMVGVEVPEHASQGPSRGAAARGRTGGRKPVVTEDKLKRAQALVAKGLTVREAAMRVKVGKTALYKVMQGAAD